VASGDSEDERVDAAKLSADDCDGDALADFDPLGVAECDVVGLDEPVEVGAALRVDVFEENPDALDVTVAVVESDAVDCSVVDEVAVSAAERLVRALGELLEDVLAVGEELVDIVTRYSVALAHCEACAVERCDGDALTLGLAEESAEAVAEADAVGVCEVTPVAVAGAEDEANAEVDAAAVAVAQALELADALAAGLLVGLTLAVTVALALTEPDAQLLSSAEGDFNTLPVPVPERESEAVADDVLLARADSALLRDARADAVAVAESVSVADAQLLALALGEVDAEPDADGDERDDGDSSAEPEAETVDIVERDARVDGEPLREPRALGDEDDESDCVREERAEVLTIADIEQEGDADGDAVEERVGNDAEADGEPLALDESDCVDVPRDDTDAVFVDADERDAAALLDALLVSDSVSVDCGDALGDPESVIDCVALTNDFEGHIVVESDREALLDAVASATESVGSAVTTGVTDAEPLPWREALGV
jgi:hypothetical protein